jgi:uncharacterized membrane protein (DUF106 family)
VNPYLELSIEIAVITGLVVGLGIVVYAEVDYNELQELQVKVGEAEVQFKAINREIVDLKIEQRNLKQQLSDQIKILDNTKIESRTDWDAIPKIKVMEESVTAIEIKIDENNVKLGELEEQRNEFSDIALNLQDQFESDTKQFKIENTFDPSPYHKMIGITLSKSCEIALQNDIETDCPTYRELKQLDNSITEVSGAFGTHDGFYSRGESDYENSRRIYDHSPILRIIVDPPADQINHIKLITIEDNFKTYFLLEDRYVINNTRTFQELRFVDGCHYAQLSTINWTSTLPDTIHYMRTGCGITGMNVTQTVEMEDTPWNPIDSPGWHYREWVDAMKQLCLGLC